MHLAALDIFAAQSVLNTFNYITGHFDQNQIPKTHTQMQNLMTIHKQAIMNMNNQPLIISP